MTRRIALVTGGTGGIGTAICHSLNAAGFTVVANYFPPEQAQAEEWLTEQRKTNEFFHITPADVTDFDSCAAMVQGIESEFGPVEVLVNCAGITRDKTLKRMTADQWNAVIDTNLNSAFNVSSQVFTGMTERGFGRIINYSGIAPFIGHGPAKGMVKLGIVGLTRGIAQAFRQHGITANCIGPGLIDVERDPWQHDKSQVHPDLPVPRHGRPEEVASLAVYLASEQAGYITGQCYLANGGRYFL